MPEPRTDLDELACVANGLGFDDHPDDATVVDSAIAELRTLREREQTMNQLLHDLDAHRLWVERLVGSLPLEIGEHFERRCDELTRKLAGFWFAAPSLPGEDE